MEKQYDVFLSHRSLDKDFVRKLATDIESVSNKGKNLLTWVDEAEIKPGQSITGMVNQGLESSRYIVLILTPNYLEGGSGWTDAEWHSALYADPDNKNGKILPLLVEDCPRIPYLLRNLKVIDCRGRKYEAGLKNLTDILVDQTTSRSTFHRGQLITNGSVDRGTIISERAIPQAEPDVITENLFCNLLPIISLPKIVYVAPLKRDLLKKKKKGGYTLPPKKELVEALHLIQEQQNFEKKFTPAFRCFEDKIITFHNLESPDSIFNELIEEEEVAAIPTKDLMIDEDDRILITSLLNMSLSRHMFKHGLIVDNEKKDRYFFPLKDSGEHIISWNPFKKRAQRTVAKPYKKNDVVECWLHQGAYLKMFFLANNYYIQILPTWVITENGNKLKGGSKVSSIVNRWTSGERNLSLIYHVRFWTYILKGKDGHINIRVGDQIMGVSIKPAFIQLPYGISSDFKDLLSNLDQEAEHISEIENHLVDLAIQTDIEEDDEEDEIEDFLDEEDLNSI